MRKIKISYTTRFGEYAVEYVNGYLFISGGETFREIEEQVVSIIADDLDDRGYEWDDVVDYEFKVTNNTEEASFTEQAELYV